MRKSLTAALLDGEEKGRVAAAAVAVVVLVLDDEDTVHVTLCAALSDRVAPLLIDAVARIAREGDGTVGRAARSAVGRRWRAAITPLSVRRMAAATDNDAEISPCADSRDERARRATRRETTTGGEPKDGWKGGRSTTKSQSSESSRHHHMICKSIEGALCAIVGLDLYFTFSQRARNHGEVPPLRRRSSGSIGPLDLPNQWLLHHHPSTTVPSSGAGERSRTRRELLHNRRRCQCIRRCVRSQHCLRRLLHASTRRRAHRRS